VAVLRDGKLSFVIDELPGEEENRFNDVIADPAGRVFCGTMPRDSGRALRERLGTLYRLDTDGSITAVLGGLGVSNGMGFTLDRKQMYFTDSPDYKIYLFDYDAGTGDISNRRVFVETPDDGGLPDGMTVDAEGYVWSARAGGSVLVRYTPDGAQERSVGFPAKMVSSVTFGGADLDQIYVTTIGGDDRAEQGPGAGALFRLNFGIKGVPEFMSRVGL
jgi:D-xylonolactonase